MNSSTTPEFSPAATIGSEAGGETYRVVKVIHGEVTSYQPGTLVKARNIHNGRATVTNMHGMGCIVGVPMDRLALAKPASSPAGGDVRSFAIKALYQFADLTARHWQNKGKGGPGLEAEMEKAEQAAIDAITALSASTSAAEPVAWIDASALPLPKDTLNTSHMTVVYASRSDGFGGRRIPLYATPPAPAAVDGQRVKEAVEQERSDVDDCLRVCEESSQRSMLPGCADIAMLRGALLELRNLRDKDRIRACLATDKEGA